MENKEFNQYILEKFINENVQLKIQIAKLEYEILSLQNQLNKIESEKEV